MGVGAIRFWAAWLDGLWSLPASSWRSREDLLRLQTRRLRALVRHAYENVPFHRERFDQAGLRPGDVRTLDDLSRIPLTSREEVQSAQLESLLARGTLPESLLRRSTSGSTGAPLTVRRRWIEEQLLLAIRIRKFMEMGLRWRDRRAAVTLSMNYRGLPSRPAPAGPAWYERLGLLRRDSIAADLPAEEIAGRLAELNPDVVSGGPGALCWFLQRLGGERRPPARPRTVLTGGETLTSGMRQCIEEAFEAPVLDSYGSHEFLTIASQCRQTGGYHVSGECVIVEVLRDGRPAGPGEEGELVGTALYSYAMPFIRFRLCDLVVKGEDPCPCGAPYATLRSIQGRVADLLRLPDGREVHPNGLYRLINGHPAAVRRLQLVQQRPDLLVVRLHAANGGGAGAFDDLAAQISAFLGGKVQVVVEQTKSFPPSHTGKFYPFISYERLQRWEQPIQ